MRSWVRLLGLLLPVACLKECHWFLDIVQVDTVQENFVIYLCRAPSWWVPSLWIHQFDCSFWGTLLGVFEWFLRNSSWCSRVSMFSWLITLSSSWNRCCVARDFVIRELVVFVSVRDCCVLSRHFGISVFGCFLVGRSWKSRFVVADFCFSCLSLLEVG